MDIFHKNIFVFFFSNVDKYNIGSANKLELIIFRYTAETRMILSETS